MSTLAPSFLIRSSSYLQVTRTSVTSRTRSKFGQIGPKSAEVAALERMKKIPKTYNGENDVITFSPLFLIGSFSYLQDMYRSLNEFEIQPDATTGFHGNR